MGAENGCSGEYAFVSIAVLPLLARIPVDSCTN